jgi:CBS domain containing-hemolysin-like protein
VIGTLLVANNVVNVAITALASWLLIELFGSEAGLAIATVLVSVVLLLLGEVTPKLYAATHPEGVAFAFVRPFAVLMEALGPVARFFTWAGRALLRLARVPTKRRSPLVTEEEIKVMIQMGREAGVLAEEELRMLHRIFEFSDSLVREAMISREEIAGIEISAGQEQAMDALIEQDHSRIPVYRDDLDHVIGVLYARDLLTMVRHGSLFVLSDLIRPVAFTPGSKRVAELLSEFQRDKTQIAIVQDRAGRTIGLVTLEDLLEELVGEIHEEAPKRRGPKPPSA